MMSALIAAAVLTLAPQSAPAAPDRPIASVVSAPSSPGVAASDPSVTQLSEIVVEGRRLEEAATEFVTEVGATPFGARRARWHSPICVSITNLRAPFGQFVIDRVATHALEQNIEVGGPGCRPNVIILATSDGPALANRLVREAGLGFRPTEGATNLDRAALTRFRTSSDPIRWWHVAVPVSAETGQLAARLRGEGPPSVVVRDGSRLVSSVRYDLGWVIIVIDMTRTQGASMGAIADYASMVALAQINPEADMSNFDTILNVFKRPAGVEGLSDWDWDYLGALYNAPTNRKTEAQQERDLVGALMQTHEATQATPVE